MRFDTKIAIVLDEQPAGWQKANVTAFLISGIAATDPALVGEPYIDGSGNRYLPMCRQPIMVYAADRAGLRRAYERAMAREVERLAVFTHDLLTKCSTCCAPTPNEPRSRRCSTDDKHVIGMTKPSCIRFFGLDSSFFREDHHSTKPLPRRTSGTGPHVESKPPAHIPGSG